MVVNRYGNNLFGLILPNDILVKLLLDLLGFEKLDFDVLFLFLVFLGFDVAKDFVHCLDTILTDSAIHAVNQHFVVRDMLSAETTIFFWRFTFCHWPFCRFSALRQSYRIPWPRRRSSNSRGRCLSIPARILCRSEMR